MRHPTLPVQFGKVGLFVCAILLVGSCLPAFSQEPSKRKLTNQDVLEMASLGLGDDVILEKIHAAPETVFNTDIDSLKALKAAHLSDAVIRAMINPKATTLATTGANVAAAPAVVNPNLPEDVGVYIKVRGKLAEVAPEVVGYKSGGVLKSMATYGLDKGHINGTVHGPKSTLQIGNDSEFIIRCPEGTVITEYQLLRLDMKGDRREFRSWTGGIVHHSQGAERNEEKFDSEKIAPRIYKIKLPALKKGEYGILPPGNTSGNLASSGKLYTFGIIE